MRKQLTQSNHARTIEQRDSIRQYLEGLPWGKPVAVTLTLKQRLRQQQLDLYAATSNFRHFTNRLNRKAFGNAVSRHSKGLRVIPVLEHDELVRFHNHAIIDRPEHITFGAFREVVEVCWLKNLLGLQTDGNRACHEPWLDQLHHKDRSENRL